MEEIQALLLNLKRNLEKQFPFKKSELTHLKPSMLGNSGLLFNFESRVCLSIFYWETGVIDISSIYFKKDYTEIKTKELLLFTEDLLYFTHTPLNYQDMYYPKESYHIFVEKLKELETLINEILKKNELREMEPDRLIREGKLVELQDLFKSKPDLTFTDLEGRGLIANAVIAQQKQILIFLLNVRKSEIDLQDDNGQAALHISARLCLPEYAKILIENGADVNLKDNFGNGPLWHAVFNTKGIDEKKSSCFNIVTLLLAKGADKNSKNFAGRTPKEFALQVGKTAILIEMEKYWS